MKISAEVTIAIGQYENIKPRIEIEVPDTLTGPALVEWLHREYHGLLSDNPQKRVDRAVDAINDDRPLGVPDWERASEIDPNGIRETVRIAQKRARTNRANQASRQEEQKDKAVEELILDHESTEDLPDPQ